MPVRESGKEGTEKAWRHPAGFLFSRYLPPARQLVVLIERAPQFTLTAL
jgi:hypothetical protein